MARRAALSVGAATLAMVALPACGVAQEQTDPEAPAGKPPSRSDRRAPVYPGAGAAASARRGIALKRLGSFDTPVYVTGAPGFPRLLFVVERGGRVVALRGGRRAGTFLDIASRVSVDGERGLLSIAFPPDYRRSGLFYVYYTDRQGDIRVDEFRRRSATRAAPGSRRTVIEIPHRANSNHNGGQLQFLGNLLYFGTGDGGSGGDPPNNAQDRGSLLGKLLRIDPRPSGGRPYSIPAGNPFVGTGGGRGEIYSYGLRNPFRFSFDTVTSRQPRIAIADVGQDAFEELDYTTVAGAAGANFGWDAFEGLAPYTGANSGTRDPGGTTKPILAYPHSRGGSCSIIGGYVVGDPRLPALRGRYLYADLCEGRLRSLVPHPRRAAGDRRLGPSVSTPSSFGEDTQGRIYAVSLEGPVYRLVPRPADK